MGLYIKWIHLLILFKKIKTNVFIHFVNIYKDSLVKINFITWNLIKHITKAQASSYFTEN